MSCRNIIYLLSPAVRGLGGAGGFVDMVLIGWQEARAPDGAAWFKLLRSKAADVLSASETRAADGT